MRANGQTATVTLTSAARARTRLAPLRLTIFHTGDVHGRIAAYPDAPAANTPSGASATGRPGSGTDATPGIGPLIGGYPALATLLQRERLAALKEGSLPLWLDSGDFFQGTPVVASSKGACMIDLMNRIRCVATTPGNHEFDHGWPWLIGRMRDARFPFVVCNVFRQGTGQLLPGARSYALLEHRGWRIAITGILTPETAQMTFAENLAGLEIRDPRPILRTLVPRLRSAGADIVILLSHQGFDEDRHLAGEVPGIDILLGGHSHTPLQQPVIATHTGTLISHAGTALRQVNRIDLVKRSQESILEFDFRSILLTVASFPEDPGLAAVVASYTRETEEAMRTVVGQTEVDLIPGVFGGDSPIGSVMADVMRAHTNADFAFINWGGVRTPLWRGPITLGDLFLLQPFDNVVDTLEMTGRQIRDLITRMLSAGYRPMTESDRAYGRVNLRIKADGMVRDARGATGFLIPSNLRITYDPARPPESRLTELVDGQGKPLDPARTYRVAFPNFITAGGDGFPELASLKKTAAGQRMIRDLLAEHIRQVKSIKRPPEPRIFNQRLSISSALPPE